jgi:hypothetical protein
VPRSEPLRFHKWGAQSVEEDLKGSVRCVHERGSLIERKGKQRDGIRTQRTLFQVRCSSTSARIGSEDPYQFHLGPYFCDGLCGIPAHVVQKKKSENCSQCGDGSSHTNKMYLESSGVWNSYGQIGYHSQSAVRKDSFEGEIMGYFMDSKEEIMVGRSSYYIRSQEEYW